MTDGNELNIDRATFSDGGLLLSGFNHGEPRLEVVGLAWTFTFSIQNLDHLERFQDKWTRLSGSKTRQNKDLEPNFGSTKIEEAPAVWFHPGDNFICIEPWASLPARADGREYGEPARLCLGPGGNIHFSLSMTFEKLSGGISP